jgi:predicted NBD/HSP70 family sugar kinase
MSTACVAIGGLAAATVVVKGAAPLLLGGRELPPRLLGVVALFASALLAALVVVETVTDARAIRPDARLVGLGAAGVVLARRRDAMLPAVIVAAAATALTRALS